MVTKSGIKLSFLFLFILLCLLFSIFEYQKTKTIEKYLSYLLFEKDGTFSLRDQHFSILWKSNLNQSLVSTNILVNNLNFDVKIFLSSFGISYMSLGPSSSFFPFFLNSSSIREVVIESNFPLSSK